MSKQNKFQNVLTAVKRMALDVVDRLKKMDRRLLIMVASAVVLLLIVIILIASGVKANKKEIPEAEISTDDPAVLYNDPGTNNNTNNTIVAVGAGKYKVNTGSDADLNMRRAAGSKYDRITSIPNGTVVDVLFVDDQVDAKGWGYIRYNGDSGWVSMEFLTPAQ